MLQELENYKRIRYTRLYFTLRFLEDTELVREKASAIRGGMGEMLLRAHCISDRQCDTCGFEEECMVQRVMYSRFSNAPEFMQTGKSVGYIISCSNHERNFEKGDRLEFCVTLFGKTIVYFSEILNAVYALGVSGLGRNHSHFEIVSVKNLFKREILDGCNVRMERYQWQTLGEYVDRRSQRFQNAGVRQWVYFYSPLALKYRGEFVRELSSEALSEAIWRRMYILSCFEDISFPEHCQEEVPFPDILSQHWDVAEIARHSSRHDQFMKLRGIKGEIELGEISELWLELLLAGEVVHIGKNTSFGFGGYSLSSIARERNT